MRAPQTALGGGSGPSGSPRSVWMGVWGRGGGGWAPMVAARRSWKGTVWRNASSGVACLGRTPAELPLTHPTPLSSQVRRMIVGAAEAWLRDYRMDGLRFDSIKDVPMETVQVGVQESNCWGIASSA